MHVGEVDALFSVLRRHLTSESTCIFNVFNPDASRDELISTWKATDPEEEVLSREHLMSSGTLRSSYKLRRFTETPLVYYPELIYTYYESEQPVEEVSYITPMRIYYPEEFCDTIRDHGFVIKQQWGGYNDEEYGVGPVLVVQFAPN